MTIAQDVIKPVAPAYIELFKIDLTSIPTLSNVYYLTPSSGTAITWNGNSYLPWAIKLEGLSADSTGAPGRPTLTVGNLDVNKLIGTLVFTYGDIVGATVTYIRTFDTYLGTSNSMPPVTMKIARKLQHNRSMVAFELRSFLDTERAYLPDRQMLKRDFPGLGISKGLTS